MIRKTNTYYIKHLHFYILLFISIFSCQKSVDNKLHQAEQLINISVDSASFILEELQSSYPDMEDHDKALFGLLLFKVANNKENSPSIDIIDFSINYFKEKGSKESLASSYYYKSRVFKNRREYKKAVENLLTSLNLEPYINNDKLKGLIYFDLGHLSAMQGENDKSFDFLQKSSVFFEKAQETNLLSKVYLLRGWIYQSMEDFDSAIKSSKEALQITNDSIVMGDVLNDIGNSYYFKEQFDSAIYYIRKSFHFPFAGTNMASRYYNMANVYNYTAKYDSALYYVNRALEQPIDIYFEEECYRILTRIAIAKNNKEDVVKYISKRTACQDSIRILEQQPKVSVLEKIHHTDVEKARIEKQTFWLIITIAILIICTLLIIIYLIRRNKQRQIEAAIIEMELRKQEEEHKKQEEELKKQEQLVSNMSTEIRKKRLLLIHSLHDELNTVRNKYSSARKRANFQGRELIDKKIYEEVLHINDQTAFIDKMSNVLNNLPDKLQKDYPFISYKEIVWCCLYLLNLPTTDIALLLDMKQNSQYKFKQRLSKKLDLDKVKELEELLKEKADNPL